jgi:hypothetical protein
MVDDQEIQKRYAIVRIITLAMLIGSPVAYVGVTYPISRGDHLQVQTNDLFLYGGLVLAALQGILIPFVEKQQVAGGKARMSGGQSIFEAAQSIIVIRLAQIEVCYVVGVAVCFATGTFRYLPYFLGFGIVYSLIFWPTESRYTELVRKLEAL